MAGNKLISFKMLSASCTKSCNKSLSSSAPATIIGSNGNLLVDILYCLPVKSLCVFKTVSKQWQSLISDPCFERNYNLRSRRLSVPALYMRKSLTTIIGPRASEFRTLVMDGRNCFNYVPFNATAVNRCRPRIEFEQSCNGLLLYSVYDLGSDGIYHRTYVVYNPSMRCCKTLPLPPFRKTDVVGVTIAFDSAKSSYYEVVCVCMADPNKYIYHVEIYSAKTDSWRDAGDPFPFSKYGKLSKSGVYWNGSVHWDDRQSATLHYFDIECELMKTIAMPTQTYPLGEYSWQLRYFRECRGHLHLVEMRKDVMPRIDIWEMRKDYTGWNVRYDVDLSPLTTVYPGMVRDRVVFNQRFDLDVLLIEESEDSSRLILLIEDNKVISFELKSKSFKEIYHVQPDVYVEGFEYMETLAHA